jgi:hypothetical protein
METSVGSRPRCKCRHDIMRKAMIELNNRCSMKARQFRHMVYPNTNKNLNGTPLFHVFYLFYLWENHLLGPERPRILRPHWKKWVYKKVISKWSKILYQESEVGFRLLYERLLMEIIIVSTLFFHCYKLCDNPWCWCWHHIIVKKKFHLKGRANVKWQDLYLPVNHMISQMFYISAAHVSL